MHMKKKQVWWISQGNLHGKRGEWKMDFMAFFLVFPNAQPHHLPPPAVPNAGPKRSPRPRALWHWSKSPRRARWSGERTSCVFFRNLTSKNIGEIGENMEKMGTYQWKFAKLVCFTSWWISVDLWYIDLDGVPLFERSRSLATMILDDMMITCIIKSLLWIQLESF